MTAGSAAPPARAWAFLAGAIVLEVAASLCLKAALDRPALLAVVGIGFVGAFACLSQVLRAGMGLGVAYGLWGAAGVALTALASNLVFGEELGALTLAGIAVVIAGVLLVELGSHTSPRDVP